MQKLGLAFLVLATGLVSGLVLVTSASGTTATSTATFRQLQLPMGALAIDGDRVAYDLNSRDAKKPHTTKVLVWNVRTGRTVKVSGKKTAHPTTPAPAQAPSSLRSPGRAWHGSSTKAGTSKARTTS
jgi:hypothetical protein